MVDRDIHAFSIPRTFPRIFEQGSTAPKYSNKLCSVIQIECNEATKMFSGLVQPDVDRKTWKSCPNRRNLL